MASLNSCSFIGNLGKDVDVRYSPGGQAVASLSIACSDQWKDKNSGEKKERTEWVNVSAFGRLAEIMGEYLTKGSKVFIEGRMQTDKYTDKNGIEKHSTKIIANKMIMLDSRNSVPNNDHGQAQDSTPPDAPSADFDDSDIPF